MPQNFIGCDRDQPLLLPPDLREWLAEDHLAWFVIDAIEALDLDAFYASYRADGHGRAAHDPQMMLTLLSYAYAIGECSSRGIERRLADDVAFRVIAAGSHPDHATIARFRARHQEAIAELFSQVLGLCSQAGILDSSLLAIDGTKMAAAANNHSNRDYEQIAAEILEKAGRIDEAEDEIHGPNRGDELPEHLRSRSGRRTFIQEAKRKLAEERAATPEEIPKDREKRLEICRRRLEEQRQAESFASREFDAHRERVRHRGGHEGKPHEPPKTPEGKINITDPDSQNMKAFRGYIQGYNAQAATTKDQIIVAAEIAYEGTDFRQLDPIAKAAERELEAAGAEPIGVLLADAGYWANHAIDSLRERGITPLVAPDADGRKEPRRGRRGGPYDFMRRTLASDRGGELYSQRQWVAEGVFAQIKAQRGIGRFKRRGRAAVRSEWRLIAATHNLLKLHRHSLAAATG